MSGPAKIEIGSRELASIVDARLKRSPKYENLRYKIVATSTNNNDENFNIEIMNPAELHWFTVQEARFIIFAPVLRQFRLNGNS